MTELILGFLIGIVVATIVWGIVSYKSDMEWFEHCIKLNDDNHKFNQQINENWNDFCTKMINRLTEEKEGKYE